MQGMQPRFAFRASCIVYSMFSRLPFSAFFSPNYTALSPLYLLSATCINMPTTTSFLVLWASHDRLPSSSRI